MSNDKKPAIRFKDYSDDWEQRKLENILSLENGFAFQSEYFVEEKTGYVVATPGNVSVEGGFICEGGKIILLVLLSTKGLFLSQVIFLLL